MRTAKAQTAHGNHYVTIFSASLATPRSLFRPLMLQIKSLSALGPLDRIVQAAGRCNREGRLPEPGAVIIFDPAEGKTPRGWYESATDLTRRLLKERGFKLDSPDNHTRYFRELWQQVGVSGREVQQRCSRRAVS